MHRACAPVQLGMHSCHCNALLCIHARKRVSAALALKRPTTVQLAAASDAWVPKSALPACSAVYDDQASTAAACEVLRAGLHAGCCPAVPAALPDQQSANHGAIEQNKMMHCLLGVSLSAQGSLGYSGRNADGSCQTLQVCNPGLASCQQVCGRVDLLVS